MTERGTPVVILFIITIGILLYQYAAEFRITNNTLRQELDTAGLIIDRQKQANDRLVNIVKYLYIEQYGEPIPSDQWIDIKSDDTNPVH